MKSLLQIISHAWRCESGQHWMTDRDTVLRLLLTCDQISLRLFLRIKYFRSKLVIKGLVGFHIWLKEKNRKDYSKRFVNKSHGNY